MINMRAPGLRYVEPAVATTVASTRARGSGGARSSNSSRLVSRRTSMRPGLVGLKEITVFPCFWQFSYIGLCDAFQQQPCDMKILGPTVSGNQELCRIASGWPIAACYPEERGGREAARRHGPYAASTYRIGGGMRGAVRDPA